MKNERTHEERRWWPIAVVLIAVLFSGCAAGTREAAFGPLANGHALVRLVVSEDLDALRHRGSYPPRSTATLAASSPPR